MYPSSAKRTIADIPLAGGDGLFCSNNNNINTIAHDNKNRKPSSECVGSTVFPVAEYPPSTSLDHPQLHKPRTGLSASPAGEVRPAHSSTTTPQSPSAAVGDRCRTTAAAAADV